MDFFKNYKNIFEQVILKKKYALCRHDLAFRNIISWEIEHFYINLQKHQPVQM